MSWKSVLYEYVQNRNSMDVDCSAQTIQPYVTDERYMEIQQKRLARMLERAETGGGRPVQKETRLRLMDADDWGDEVHVKIALLQETVYETLGKRLIEYKMEEEWLSMHLRNGLWMISRIVTGVGESNPASSIYGDAVAAFERVSEEDVAMTSKTSVEWPVTSAIAATNGTNPIHQPYISNHVFSPMIGNGRYSVYQRDKVAAYADRWWNGANPNYLHFEVDCSNYVSQCLFAGGAAMIYTGKRASGWWYQGRTGNQELWSYSWAVAHSLQLYLLSAKTGVRAEQKQHPQQLELGDVIAYSWEGNGIYGHSVIVTAFTSDGMPLVNAHTVDSKHRYWDYRDSYAWTVRTQYRFLHIIL